MGAMKFGTLNLLSCLALLGACSQPAQQEGNASARAEPSAKASASPSSPPAPSGPFGLTMGQPEASLDLDTSEQGAPGEARLLRSVPRPMGEFETYAALAYPNTGLCEIRAVSRVFESDSYGHNVKSAMDSLAALLDSRYGRHRKSDSCSDRNCEFFQQNLRSGSQVYSYRWSSDTGGTLANGLGEVVLVAMPGEFNGTFFRLDYRSANRQACEAARTRARAAAL